MAAHSRAHVEARTGQARTTAITATATSAAAQPVRQRVSQLTPSRRVQAHTHSHLQPFAFTFTVSHTILSLSLTRYRRCSTQSNSNCGHHHHHHQKKLAPLFRTCFRRDGKHTHTLQDRRAGWETHTTTHSLTWHQDYWSEKSGGGGAEVKCQTGGAAAA